MPSLVVTQFVIQGELSLRGCMGMDAWTPRQCTLFEGGEIVIAPNVRCVSAAQFSL